MDFKTLSLEIKDHVGVLTLNRPQDRNAMTMEMSGEFAAAVAAVHADAQVKVLVLTGAGSAFCSGADLEMVSGWTRETPETVQRDLLTLYSRFLSLAELPVPTIAALNGAAIGAGACLAMACDLRLAASDAKIGFTFIKLGLNPGMGSEFWLTRLVGPGRAMQLLMTGDILSAQDALAMGLLNQVTPAKFLQDQVMDLASKIAAKPGTPIRSIKEITLAVPHSNLAEILRMEATRQSLCFQSPNVSEGIRAIREKRKACFVEESCEP